MLIREQKRILFIPFSGRFLFRETGLYRCLKKRISLSIGKILLILCAAGYTSPFSAVTVYADQITELKEQVQLIQQQMNIMQKEYQLKIEALLERIAALEAGGDRQAQGTQGGLEAQSMGKPPACSSGITFPKGTRWELKGELEFEFVDTGNFTGANEPQPHFQLDKLVLAPKVFLNDDAHLYSEIEFYSSSLLVKYVYMHIDNLPYESFLRVGIYDRFMAVSRKTERYPLAGNTFWRDSAAGIFTGGQCVPFYWRFSYTNGYELNKREVTEDNSLDMLHDNLKTSGYSSPGEFGLGLGGKKDFKRYGQLDLLGFGYLGRLSQADEAYLKNNIAGYTSGRRDRNRYGANLDYRLKDFSFFAQCIKAQDGDLARVSWYLQPSYKIRFPERKFLKAVEPLFRYGQLSVDIDTIATNALTWDREEFTFAVLTDLWKDVKFKTEYTIDRMDKGSAGTKDYGEFVAQLEVKF